MLRKTEKSVEIVAMECGFMDSKAMNKILKRNYGQTAKYFRSQYLP
jgi:transcriptional regulator GlxA family with amidase domain